MERHERVLRRYLPWAGGAWLFGFVLLFFNEVAAQGLWMAIAHVSVVYWLKEYARLKGWRL